MNEYQLWLNYEGCGTELCTLEGAVHPEKLFLKDRWLEDIKSDYKSTELSHYCRKILGNYDPKTNKVLLSKCGSLRLASELEKPDREFTLDELYAYGYWRVRAKDWKPGDSRGFFAWQEDKIKEFASEEKYLEWVDKQQIEPW
jgi:hypothetical protein